MDMNFKDIKKIGLKNLIMLLIAGILILLCALPELFQENKNDNTTEVQTTEISVMTEEERLERLLGEIEGVGKVRSMIYFTKSDDTQIEGVVVVAEGVGKNNVSQYISDAIEALFGIPKHKIIILPMRRDNGSTG